MILTVQMKDTVLTSKGTTTIPAAIRQAAGLFPGGRIAWDFADGEIRARRREGGAAKAQMHIRKYAGMWQGIVRARNYCGGHGHDPGGYVGDCGLA
jgi:beta-glucanase (GH16 family)